MATPRIQFSAFQWKAPASFLCGYNGEFVLDTRKSKCFAAGKVGRILDEGAHRSIKGPIAAVFLDRDGTLNVDVHRLASSDQLDLLPGVADAVRRLSHAQFLSIVITNQSAIARGELVESDLDRIHAKLQALLEKQGAYLTATYHCPHHPDANLPGGRQDLMIECNCRKPATGMIQRAVTDFAIDLSISWMIGDTTTDLQTARNAGLRSVLVQTGYGGRDARWRIRPDYEFFDLNEATNFIVDQYPPLLDEARTRLARCDSGGLVAIGGLARSGKSIWASILSEALAERGQRSVILPLDSWLLSAVDRRPGHVFGRYDVESISALVERLSGRSERLDLRLGHFDRFTGERSADGYTVEIEPEDVVLFEGIPALAIPALSSASSSTFLVECPESVRRLRLAREYALRGLSDSEIELLCREREVSEHSIVRASEAAADFRIDCGS